MLIHSLLLLACLADEPKTEASHARNHVYTLVLGHGLEAPGASVKLPPPRLTDGQDAASQRAALSEVAGSEGAVDDLLRDSVTAPYIIKVRDVKGTGVIIRLVDLWFVVHAELTRVDPAKEAARADQKAVEAGNMRFQTRLLKPDDLRSSGTKEPAPAEGVNTWYSHIHGRLLDRIEFDATNQVMVSQSGESIVIASRTDPAFGNKPPLGNGWKPAVQAGGSKPEDSGHAFEGGISYAKISRATIKPGAIVVEMHAAFVEPEVWFSGSPILRSKFSIVAQDQIRALRRELAKTAKK
jgi:hypothetical protein